MRYVEAGDRRSRAVAVMAGLGGLLIIAVILSIALGPAGVSLNAVGAALGDLFPGIAATIDRRDLIIVQDIRMPRTALGVLVGAGLAVAGAVMQGLFRNPLADPGLVGVSAGAALAAVSVIVLGGTVLGPLVSLLSIWTLPFSAFIGGLAATSLLYAISTRRGRTSVATMLLAGIALGAMAGAFTGVLVFISDDSQLRDLTFWSLGSLGGATWSKVFAAAPFILLVIVVSPFIARGLNGLALGEADAHYLGVPVQRLKRLSIFLVACATGAAVGVSGVIGFVGIVVPHLLRLAIGPDHRYLLPASALLGAALLLGADLLARNLVAPAELPIGIVTAALGAPFFLWILLRQRGILDL